MGYFGATWKALSTTMRTAFREPTTIEFPAVRRERAPRIRASFALTHDENGEENCIGCKACEHICPSDVITVVMGPKRVSEFTGKKRGYSDDFTLDLQACIICELCIQVCPTDAIIMTREQEIPGYAREDLVLISEKLYANEQKALAWSSGSILREMQDPDLGLSEAQLAARKAKKPAAKKPVVNKPIAKPPAAKAAAEEPSAAAPSVPDEVPAPDAADGPAPAGPVRSEA